jgi:glyoxylase-like metal-dependent hydrolase (beta-lactamase superfamily II)
METLAMGRRHPLNASGDWYVDTRCIDCGAALASEASGQRGHSISARAGHSPEPGSSARAARTVAPGLIVEGGGQSVFARQARTADELLQAWRARLLCPTASVRIERHAGHAPEGAPRQKAPDGAPGPKAPEGAPRQKVPDDAFPEEMTPGVYRLGYNAKSSYGAHSFGIRRAAGNVMVDAPRFNRAVVAQFERWGGLGDILLTHRDDVGDAERYGAHFAARVWIHAADRDAAPFADNVLAGHEPLAIAADLLAVPVPGHTAGSVAYLYDGRCLFTGDSLAWNFEHDDLEAFRDYCWWSWPEQLRSLRRLLAYRFEWVFAGHGGSHYLPADAMRARLAGLLERMTKI